MAVKETIHAKGLDIAIFTNDYKNEYISLTDIARYKSDEPKDVIKNWMRSKDTIEFLGLWEVLHNPDFKGVEFDSFRNQAGANAFTMSPKKWIEHTGAIGIISKSHRHSKASAVSFTKSESLSSMRLCVSSSNDLIYPVKAAVSGAELSVVPALMLLTVQIAGLNGSTLRLTIV